MDVEQPSEGTPEVATSGSQTGPFFLSEAFTPVPAKLVKKIQALEFVDMADLLPDNIEIRRREEGSSLGEAVTAVGRRARQVAQLSTWVQCFTTYIAIVAERHPSRVQDMLAYLMLIVREAQRAGGDAWRQYDARFRNFAAVHQSVTWGQPLPFMYASCFMASRAVASPCEHCLELDHSSAECALASHCQPLFPQLDTRSVASSTRFVPYLSAPARPWVDYGFRPICRRWNMGACKGARWCTFRHACGKCGERGHRSGECRGKGPASASSHQRAAEVLDNTCAVVLH